MFRSSFASHMSCRPHGPIHGLIHSLNSTSSQSRQMSQIPVALRSHFHATPRYQTLGLAQKRSGKGKSSCFLLHPRSRFKFIRWTTSKSGLQRVSPLKDLRKRHGIRVTITLWALRIMRQIQAIRGKCGNSFRCRQASSRLICVFILSSFNFAWTH